MKQSYLVQRGEFKDTKLADITGIDSLIKFEYMGSAEFEWGTLPKSLKRILDNIDNYEMFYLEVLNSEGNLMVVICDKNDQEDATINALMLADDSARLKEFCGLEDHIKGTQRYSKTNFWWDIQNDFMICFDNNMDRLMKGVKTSEVRLRK